MTRATAKRADELTFADLPDILTISEAAKAARLSIQVIRSAIKRGELSAFIPGARPARAPGRGLGYRIRRQDLQAWFFGTGRRGEA